jgi:3D (Asp-Asp-Asp) domain-containing protein
VEPIAPVVRSRTVRGPSGRLLALAAGTAAATLLPAAGGAGTSSRPAQRAAALRSDNTVLAARSSRTLLGLYSLDARLDSARAQLATLNAEAAGLERRRAEVRTQIRIAQHALVVSERRLGERLRALYEQGGPDPLAVLFGASSLDEAITVLDDLNRTAVQDKDVIAQTRAARRTLRRLSHGLAARDAHVRALRDAAAATAAALESARAERAAYLARIAAQQRLNRTQISSLETQAQAVAARAHTLTAAQPVVPTEAVVVAPAPPPAVVPAPVAGGRTLTVEATGYSMSGRTATGAPVGYGVVAVDPSVIPLGSRMTIPGYGEGVAADTGGAVRGATIDLWFPSTAQALAWGRRTVTITVH